VQGSWSAEAARDRLASLLFLAALVHGIVILGVTFTADAPQRQPAATSLEVVLVTRDYEKLPAPRNPALLSQQNLIGRGNAPADARLRTALPRSDEPALPGPDQIGALTRPEKSGTRRPAEARITAAARNDPRVRRGETGATVTPAAQRALVAASDDPVEILADPDDRTVIPDANPRELLVSASTQESRIAGYLNTWKTRVERIGTLNFPRSAELARIRAYPVLEVAITADGKLKEVVVRNSSGHRNLDQAAMEILRIAAPFEPFPQPLREDYDVLRFAYEWHFGSGDGRGRVTSFGGS
jgi:protein TonB